MEGFREDEEEQERKECGGEGKETGAKTNGVPTKFMDSPGMGQFGVDPRSSISLLSCLPVTGK